MSDLALLARRLAIHHIRSDVERGFGEQSIRNSHHHSSCGQSFVDNNPNSEHPFGAYDVSIGTIKYPTSKVVVRRVVNTECDFAFSLSELYQECKKGQLALL